MARVESKTYVCTERKEDAVPIPRTGVEGTLGNWKAPGVMDEELGHKFHGCMTGNRKITRPITAYIDRFGVHPLTTERLQADVWPNKLNCC